MYDLGFKTFPWRRFRDFISPKAVRFTMLKEILEESALDYRILEIGGNRHFFIAPPHREEFPRRLPAILVAHYDRADGSPGANDNSASVFLILEAAVKLWEKGVQNWIIIFTDKEELRTGESIREQGSYSLAVRLKSLKMEHARIFNFDACGTGDTLVISTTLEYLLKRERSGERLRESVAELRKMALDTARNLGMAKVLLAPTPFSDDAGFFSAGLAAQTITVLPSSECMQLVAELRKNQNFAEALISAELRQTNSRKSIPETWRCFNSPSDSHLRLTPENFRTIVRFAEALCTG